MSDKEILIEMFKRSKIDYKEEKNNIEIEAGYIGFVSMFSFDEENNLKSVEAYE